MLQVVYVIPCFNEAARLDLAGFAELLELTSVSLLFVDDGSTDETLATLAPFARAHEGRVRVLSLAANGGKGEAVRAGLRDALEAGASLVGYADADLATPPDELARLARFALDSHADVVMGSRVARAGAAIERQTGRHYLGRVFATYASVLLDARIYDTQCGAKVLRGGPRLGRALARPFVSRWAFDVELLGRLLYDRDDPMPFDRVIEVPLERWRDIGGSHIRVSGLPSIALDVARASWSMGALRWDAKKRR